MASTRMLAAVHFVVNALLLWLGYYWLGVGESRAASLAWSALVALLLVCFVCCAYGSVLAYFQTDADRRVIAAWREALRNLLPLALAALVIVAIYVLLARWADYSATPATNVASYLTLKLRKPVKPSTMLRRSTTLTGRTWRCRVPIVRRKPRRTIRTASEIGRAHV